MTGVWIPACAGMTGKGVLQAPFLMDNVAGYQ